MDTTFEQAQRCTFCEQPSSLINAKRLPQGGKLHTFECKNERCPDHGGRRIIQTNPDGSLAQRGQGPKTFEKLNHFSEGARRAREELQLLELESRYPHATRQELIRFLGGLDGSDQGTDRRDRPAARSGYQGSDCREARGQG